MTALGYRHLAGHVLAVGILILTFGFGVYSLSIDVAHHFLLIDALGKEDPSTLAAIPAMQPMAHYPRGSHWLAAGLGVLIGSPYAAMWLLSLLSVYAGYYALGRLAQLSGGYVALAAFALLLLILRSTGAMTGHEIIGNFFYAQLVATAIFFGLLILAGSVADRGDWAPMAVALFGAAVLMTVHLLPGLDLLGTVGFALLIKLVFRFFRGEPVTRKSLDLVGYGIAAVTLVLLHPSFAQMREISRNDGWLSFPLDARILIVGSVVFTVLSAGTILWRSRKEQNPFDLVLVAAMFSSVAMMTLQLLALAASGEGSPYAVKKHLFIVVPLVLVGIARAFASFMPRERSIGQHSPFSAIAIALFATWWIYPATPVIPIRQVTTPLNFAESGVATGLPEFQPGNTAIFASSVDPISRYMINLSVFRMPFPEALKLLAGQSDAARYTYVMYDRADPRVTPCRERGQESSRYAFVAGTCITTIEPNTAYPHTGLGSAVQFSGWSEPEAAHRWSAGPEGSITLSGLPQPNSGLCLLLNGFTLGRQTITASIEGREVAQTALDGEGAMTVPLPQVSGPVTVKLAFSNPHRPDNGDPRSLAFAIRTILIKMCDVPASSR